MANLLKSVVAKLNNTMRATLEDAAGLCLARTHYDVEIEHFLTKLLEAGGTDFAGIVQHFGVDKTRLSGELSRSLDKLKSGNARSPAFSPSLFRMLREAWTLGSLEFGAAQVRSGTAILALVAMTSCRGWYWASARSSARSSPRRCARCCPPSWRIRARSPPKRTQAGLRAPVRRRPASPAARRRTWISTR